MTKQINPSFDPAPYKKAILEIKTVEKRILKEVRAEAEKQDRQKEILNLSNDAS